MKALPSIALNDFSGTARDVTARFVKARTSLLRVRESLEAGIPSDLVAQDLREAIATLNSILGRHIDSTTILNHIFKNHCIGK